LVYDVSRVCTAFPDLPSPVVQRENLLDTIDYQFNSGAGIVVVEGPEGSGRTTLVTQFALRHPQRTVGLFLRGTAKWAYDLSVLQFDLVGQLENILLGTETDETAVDEALVRARLFQLSKRARRYGETYYFVVDGLWDIPEEEEYVRERVIDTLPFGAACFRFLVSTTRSASLGNFTPKTMLIPGFSFEEAAAYLGDIVPDRELLRRINRLSRGMPGHLAVLRRLIVGGTPAEHILEDSPQSRDLLGHLLGTEWERFSAQAEDLELNMVALLAHDRRNLSIPFLSRALGTTPDVIRDRAANISFLDVDNETVSFVSESVRRVCAEKLEYLREEVMNLVIERLLSGNKEEPESLLTVPRYLQQAGRLGELLEFVSCNNLVRLIDISQSLLPAQEQIEYGVSAALETKNDQALIRLTMARSMLSDLDESKVLSSEVEALVALGDVEAAYDLTQRPRLKEDRLGLLSVLARACENNGLSVDQTVTEEITQLVSVVNFAALGERAVDIAIDLVHALPETAVSIVEKAGKSNLGENSFDWAWIRFSLEALRVSGTVERRNEIAAQVKNPDLRRFLDEVGLLVRGLTAKQVIESVSRFEQVSDKLLFLRQWILLHRQASDVTEAMDLALRLALTSPLYAPNAQVMRDLATPLPHIHDPETVEHYIQRFDSHAETARRNGPTEDYVRLQVTLAQAHALIDTGSARNRIIELYYQVSEIEDLAVQTACLARLLSAVAPLDPKLQLEEREGLQSLVRENLVTNLSRLLEASAEQEYAARGVIRALARSEPATAMAIIQSINTEPRRDRSYFALVRSLLKAPLDQLQLDVIAEAIESINSAKVKDRALLSCFERFESEAKLGPATLNEFVRLAELSSRISDVSERCRAHCLVLKTLARSGAANMPIYDTIKAGLRAAWDEATDAWQKVDLGYKISGSIAKDAPNLARRFLEAADSIREEEILASKNAVWTIVACLRLAVRAHGGLLSGQHDRPEDEVHLANLIRRIPSPVVQAEMWTELALAYRLHERPEQCRRVVSERIEPILEPLAMGSAARSEVLVKCAPALYCSDRARFIDEVSKLGVHARNDALITVSDFLVQRCLPSDPYDSTNAVPHRIPFTDAEAVCELMEALSGDGIVYYALSSLTHHLAYKDYRTWYTSDQMASICGRLKRIVSGKLPDSKNIRHEGYVICSEAHILRVERRRGGVWKDLVDRACRIPNIADRVFVLCTLAETMPAAQHSLKEDVLRRARELVNEIPTNYDRVDRLEMIAAAWRGNVNEAKASLKAAMAVAIEREGPEQRLARRVIDLAYSIDPDFASSLASTLDDDPSRSLLRLQTKEQIDTQNLWQRVLKGTPLTDNVDPDRLSRAAWQALRSLKSGRGRALDLEVVRQYLQVASRLPLSRSYPLYAWAVENAVQKHARSDYARVILQGFLAGALTTAVLMRGVLDGTGGSFAPRKRSPEDLVAAGSVLVAPGQRDNAMRAIGEWLREKPLDYLKICDPYFEPDDIEVLKLVGSISPNCHVQVLTSAAGLRNQDFRTLEQLFRSAWHALSDFPPPDTDVVLVRTKLGGKPPIHDRWWITAERGLALGTSLNYFGVGAWTSITRLGPDEAREREELIDSFLSRAARTYHEEPLSYYVFTL